MVWLWLWLWLCVAGGVDLALTGVLSQILMDFPDRDYEMEILPPSPIAATDAVDTNNGGGDGFRADSGGAGAGDVSLFEAAVSIIAHSDDGHDPATSTRTPGYPADPAHAAAGGAGGAGGAGARGVSGGGDDDGDGDASGGGAQHGRRRRNGKRRSSRSKRLPRSTILRMCEGFRATLRSQQQELRAQMSAFEPRGGDGTMP